MAKLWTSLDTQIVRWLYPHVGTVKLASLLNRKIGMVYKKAAALGVSKSPEYLSLSRRLAIAAGHSSRTQFVPGMTPWNKGRRFPGWTRGRMAETQFKSGHRPQTWKPIGTTRVTREGYLERKVTDTGSTPVDWVQVHRLHWERWRGPIPPGHVVVFADGDPTHIAIANLECISRRELLSRNTVHRLPKELALAIQLQGALRRQIHRRTDAQE
jgi:hypothetical protein